MPFEGIHEILIKIKKDILIANNYKIGLAIDIPNVKIIDIPEEKVTLSIVNLKQEQFKNGDVDNGVFSLPVEYLF